MTSESQSLIEGNQMLPFYLLLAHFYMKRKTVPLQHQQSKATHKSENGKAIAMSNYNTMHTPT